MSMKKLLAALVLAPTVALAWQPTKPVTVIFPNGPGAGNEISFRIVADIVERKTGAKFNSEYRPGADGNIAINHFVTTPRDGHTISVPACQSNWVTPEIWFKDMIKYNPMDLEPIANIARSPLAFWAHPSSKINTPEEFVAAIRNRQRMTVAIGGGGHKLAVEYLVDKVSVAGSDNLQTAMYKGPAQALLDVMGGHVEFGVTPVAVGYPHVQAGKLKFIGISHLQNIQLPECEQAWLDCNKLGNLLLDELLPTNEICLCSRRSRLKMEQCCKKHLLLAIDRSFRLQRRVDVLPRCIRSARTYAFGCILGSWHGLSFARGSHHTRPTTIGGQL